jgi:hypothetical protein
VRLDASNAPDLNFYVNLPEINLPDVTLPEVNLPSNIEMPSMPEIPPLPSLNLPSLDSNAVLGDLDPTVLLGLVLVVVVASAGASGSATEASSLGKKRAKKKTPLEIPYHAAARLAYDAWLEAHPDESYDEAAYLAFQSIYEAHAVAEATSKKLLRDLHNFSNEPPPEPPVRRVSEPKATAPLKGKFFFAS